VPKNEAVEGPPTVKTPQADERAKYLTEIGYHPPSPTFLAEIRKKHPGLLVLDFGTFCAGLVLAAVPPPGETFDEIFSAQVSADVDGKELLVPLQAKGQARRIGVVATQWPMDGLVRERLWRLWPLVPYWVGQMVLVAAGFIAVPTTGGAAGT
jgi:hypothetical protein